MKGDNREMLSLISKKMCAQIKIDEIESIERKGRMLHICTTDMEYICAERIENMAPHLVGKTFYRAMVGLIINFARVVKIENDELWFESGRRYGMGKNNMAKTRSAYKNYLLRYPPFATVQWTSDREEPGSQRRA